MKKILFALFVGLVLVGCNYNEAEIDELIEKSEQKKEKLRDKEDVYVLTNTPSYSTASSTMSPYYGITYTPENATDGILNTWWSPKQKQTGSKWLKFDLERKMDIKGMRIHAGSHYPHFVHKGKDYGDLYYKNLRIRRARIVFSDGSFEKIILEDVDRIQKIYFVKTYFTSSVTIVLLDYYKQYNGWDDYCISEFDLIAPL